PRGMSTLLTMAQREPAHHGGVRRERAQRVRAPLREWPIACWCPEGAAPLVCGLAWVRASAPALPRAEHVLAAETACVQAREDDEEEEEEEEEEAELAARVQEAVVEAAAAAE